MSSVFLLVTILVPIIGGAMIPLLPFRKKRHMELFTEAVVLITSIFVFCLIAFGDGQTMTLFRFTGDLNISFKFDGLGKVFAGMVAFLWPLATLYSFEYLEHEVRESKFFLFYTMTYGVTLGIAMAENILTMYCFYEMLTLVTVPLVMFTLSREAILASRKYLYYSLGGAAFAFIGMIFIISYGDTISFTMGGVLNTTKIGGRDNILRLVYILTFLGFGVKAAIFPFNSWLPDAGVAMTPVTALLHAVAVVKAGAFATMRLTYYCYGTEFLKGSYAQTVILIIVMFTIVYGCSRAVKETHLKRRLAYSTISNLSYILFGVAIMTPLGLVGALTHMVFHAFMKICSFLCAGAIIHKTNRTYVYQLDGLAKKMPKVFALFTISALALMGVPGLCGFISKWNLAAAALESGNVLAYIGIGALLVSALLTATYMLSIVIRAYFPSKDFDESTLGDVTDPSWKMLIPLFVFASACIVLGLYSAPLVDIFGKIAKGLL